MKMEKIIKFWLPPIFWAGLIFYISGSRVPSTSPVYWQDFTAKKTAHIFEYAVFTILFYRAFLNSNFKSKKAALYSVLIAIFYAATDELHQFFTPGREPMIRDIVIDSFASLAVGYTLWKLLPKAPEKIKSWAKEFELL